MITDVRSIVYIGYISQICVLAKDSSGNILSKAALKVNIKSSQSIIETFKNNNLDSVIFELGSGRTNFLSRNFKI